MGVRVRSAGGPPNTLRRQLGMASAAVAVVLALVVAAAVYSLVQVMTYQSRVTTLYFEAIVFSDDLVQWVEDAGNAVDDYLETGFESSLDPFYASRDFEQGELRAALVDAYGEDASVVTSLDRTERLIVGWQTSFAESAIAEVAAYGPGTLSDEQVASGARLFDAAQDQAQKLVDELSQGHTQTTEQLGEWTRNLFLTVVLLAVSAVVVGLGTWYTLRRRILRPLAELAAKAEAVSEGEVSLEVRTDAPGEIASLAHAVDAMRTELVERMAAAKESEAEIALAHEQTMEQAEELRRSNRDLEQFAYVASHDLQEPLRKVASFTQLLQKRYGGELDERADQYIEFAVDGAKRMQRLIQDLLGFSRVGRSGAVPGPVDLGEACATALAPFDERIAKEGAVVEVGNLPTVVGQQTLLVQLFQNLVGNALKFRAPDRAPHIRIGAVRRPDSWELFCADNGIGIDAQYAERVFVIFQRLHAKDSYEGTGIGLALCKKIVEHHGGDIWIDTAADQGTTIRWTLPDRRGHDQVDWHHPADSPSAGPEPHMSIEHQETEDTP